MGNTTIHGLVAEYISKELGDKILSKTLKPTKQTMTFYVSNTGNDETADGSEQKPFRTVQACYDYIQRSIYFCGDTSSRSECKIKFLTDYEENSILMFNGISYSAYSPWVTINGEGHNVILKTHRVFSYGRVAFSNLTLRSHEVDKNTIMDISYTASAYIGINVTFDETNETTKSMINCGWGSLLYMPFDFIITSSTRDSFTVTDQIIVTANSSSGYISKNITIDKNINITNKGVFRAENNSFIQFLGAFNLTNETKITGKKYTVAHGSSLILNARGTALIPASEEGVMFEDNCYVG